MDAGLQYMGLLQKVSGKLRTTCQTVCMNRLGLSIEERSLEINERLRFNDLGDSAVGKDGKSSVRTLVECKAARPFALKANVRIVADMLETLMKLNERPFPFVFYFTIILNSPHLWKWSNRGHYDVIVPCLM